VASAALSEASAERILSRLVAVPSPQTSLFEADPAVQRYLRDTVAGLARELGLRPEFEPMGGVFARVGSEGPRAALIFGYAMTHPGNRMTDPFTPSVTAPADTGARLRGRGAAEQKGATAAMLMTAAALKEREAQLRGQLVVCVSPAGETGRHDAARSFLDATGLRFDWALVALGTDGSIGIGNKGRLDVSVRIRGRAAHSSTPWKGLDALRGARRLLDRLDSLELAGSHPQLGRPTLTATSIRSLPDATHTVQDEVLLTLDRRLLPGDSPEQALAQLRSAAADLGEWTVELSPGPFMYPSEVRPDASLVRLLQQAAADVGAAPLELLWSHGAIDTGFFNEQGIPAVMLGPGSPETFHADEESVALPQVLTVARLYHAAALAHLAGEGDLRPAAR
jgi:acetylornithine deacetylase